MHNEHSPGSYSGTDIAEFTVLRNDVRNCVNVDISDSSVGA